MIAHVAEAAENSGRVIVQLPGPAPASPAALPAALHVARSFGASVESLFVEDPQLFDFARFSFAQEVANDGSRTIAVEQTALEAKLESVAAVQHGELAKAASALGIPIQCRTWREAPVHALAAACSEQGPWNIAVVSEAVSAATESYVASLMGIIQDVTGFVVSGPGATRISGPVIAVVEQLAHVQPVLRAAERLAAQSREDVHLVLFGGNADETAWMDGQVRLLLDGDVAPDLILAPAVAASPDALAGFLHDIGAGFVIAPLGGALLPWDGGLAAFAANHAGPLFLIRYAL